jgi:hypothetical protein
MMARPFLAFAFAMVASWACALVPARADEDDELPAASRPRVSVEVTPRDGVVVGDVVTAKLTVDARDGDDVAVPSQSLLPFEVHRKNVRIAAPQNGRHVFHVTLELLALRAGSHQVGPVRLRVVTKEGVVGDAEAPLPRITVGSQLANVPNAEAKPAPPPVQVFFQDYTLAYVAAGLLATALVVTLALLASRWWKKRQKERTPPPPPRPPWEVALETLAALRRSGPDLVREGRAIELVDGASDALRQYLGARFSFDGLESTTDEVLGHMKRAGRIGVALADIATLLRDCDLVKFAKMEPTEAEYVAFLDSAERIVRGTMPAMFEPPPEARR